MTKYIIMLIIFIIVAIVININLVQAQNNYSYTYNIHPWKQDNYMYTELLYEIPLGFELFLDGSSPGIRYRHQEPSGGLEYLFFGSGTTSDRIMIFDKSLRDWNFYLNRHLSIILAMYTAGQGNEVANYVKDIGLDIYFQDFIGLLEFFGKDYFNPQVGPTSATAGGLLQLYAEGFSIQQSRLMTRGCTLTYMPLWLDAWVQETLFTDFLSTYQPDDGQTPMLLRINDFKGVLYSTSSSAIRRYKFLGFRGKGWLLGAVGENYETDYRALIDLATQHRLDSSQWLLGNLLIQRDGEYERNRWELILGRYFEVKNVELSLAISAGIEENVTKTSESSDVYTLAVSTTNLGDSHSESTEIKQRKVRTPEIFGFRCSGKFASPHANFAGSAYIDTCETLSGNIYCNLQYSYKWLYLSGNGIADFVSRNDKIATTEIIPSFNSKMHEHYELLNITIGYTLNNRIIQIYEHSGEFWLPERKYSLQIDDFPKGVYIMYELKKDVSIRPLVGIVTKRGAAFCRADWQNDDKYLIQFLWHLNRFRGNIYHQKKETNAEKIKTVLSLGVKTYKGVTLTMAFENYAGKDNSFRVNFQIPGYWMFHWLDRITSRLLKK